MKQSLAAAYSMKRKARKMAEGGEAKPDAKWDPLIEDKKKKAEEGMRSAFGSKNPKPLAHGGMIEADEEMRGHPSVSVAERILAKARRMAEGGEVDIELNQEEEPWNEDYDEMNQAAAMKELYEDEELEHMSMADRIRRKRSSK